MPVGLSIRPYETRDNPAHVQVKNLATVPVRVTTQDVILHGHCTGTQATGVTVSPAGFTLKPGQVRSVTIHVPAGKSADYGVIFAGTPTHHQAGVNLIADGVGFQVLTGKTTHTCRGEAVPIPPANHSLLTPTGALIAIVIVLGLILAMGGAILKRRHDRRQPTQ